ncbi:uncharacterized protein K02A2.6-like [Macrosteles quadrilineatus]|uniref:uncharacterized protein K02A2.6-like n=1 Tax=Macrosteles quadrilineatus TaxID=74068 RepID=UPI0023E1CCD5|nr:uncharacterized protein K02A2.6-like [Macrosteles quadrilineatus]
MPSDSESDNGSIVEEEKRNPRTGWIYILKKAELVEELKKFGLQSSGTVRADRRMLSSFTRGEYRPALATPPPGPSKKITEGKSLTMEDSKSLEDTRYPIPVIDEILGNIRGGNYFCLLDIHKPHLHIPVDKESQKLPAISTHRGTYLMKRLSFGIKPAPGEFAKFHRRRMTHQGIVRMKSLARRWKLIDKDIEAVAKSCRTCADAQNNQMKAPAHPWEPPKSNWERIHIDYAGPFLGHHFLIVVDSISKWPEVAICRSAPTTDSTIVHLREIFSRNGLPVTIVSDNASIFTSDSFQAFLFRNGIQHKTIAPGHPTTNGQA